MRTHYVRVLLSAVLVSALAAPATSHAWFFFIPFGLFSTNDNKTVQNLEQKQDWKGLLDLAETRLQSDENNASWLYANGLALHKLGRYEEAIQKYQRALDLKGGDYKEAQLNLGTSQLTLGSLDSALATFVDLSGKNPEFWQAYSNIILVYSKKNDPVNARLYLEQLKSRNMVVAAKLEEALIKPLELKIEQEKIATALRDQDEKNRIERERQAKQEADAKVKAEAQAKTTSDEKSHTAVAQTTKAPKSLEAQLKDLKQLYGKGLISKDVYDTSQRELLKSP